MKILQVNVRLNEGGAANVALDLHLRLQGVCGVESNFIYGYSKGARPNLLEFDLGGSHVSSRLQAITNFVTHRITGSNYLSASGILSDRLWSAINEADVVHLHVLHSYYLEEIGFIERLIEKKKRVVWTLHDHWLITGRCAFLDGCNSWRDGCGACAGKKNYPPSLLDFSKNNANIKRATIDRFINHGAVFVSPSHHLANDVIYIYPNIDIRVVPNGLDLKTEKYISNYDVCVDYNSEVVKVLVIAHDLSYSGKTNQDYVRAISKLENVELHTIGKHSLFFGDNVFNHGYVSDRENLYKIISSCDVMFFSSIVDNFPLVIGESLCLGTPVLATPSYAANEVLALLGGDVYDIERVLEILKGGVESIYATVGFDGPLDISLKAKKIFSGSIMLNSYKGIYDSLV